MPGPFLEMRLSPPELPACVSFLQSWALFALNPMEHPSPLLSVLNWSNDIFSVHVALVCSLVGLLLCPEEGRGDWQGCL